MVSWYSAALMQMFTHLRHPRQQAEFSESLVQLHTNDKRPSQRPSHDGAQFDFRSQF